MNLERLKELSVELEKRAKAFYEADRELHEFSHLVLRQVGINNTSYSNTKSARDEATKALKKSIYDSVTDGIWEKSDLDEQDDL